MTPPLLRLPSRLAREGFHWDRLTAAVAARTGDVAAHVRSAFGLSGPERRFALEVLRRHPNVWLYRCHQRAFCGDFVLVDMSPPRPAHRRPCFVELKAGVPLRQGRGGVQLGRAPMAAAWLRCSGIVGDASPTLWTGSPEVVLATLGAP